MSREWIEFDKFYNIIDMYMPDRGEGETLASQICTAVNKLVYKWYNDGDVYDNTHYLEGWENDLSSYANWLYFFAEGADEILVRIFDIKSEGKYTELLYDLCTTLLNTELLEKYNACKTRGTIYSGGGPFCFKSDDEQDNDPWFESDDEEDDLFDTGDEYYEEY